MGSHKNILFIRCGFFLLLFSSLNFYGQTDLVELSKDSIAQFKWSIELNEKSTYFEQNVLSVVSKEDSSILTMRQDSDNPSVEITSLDTNLNRQCSYRLDKSNKDFYKNRRAVGFVYSNEVPYLLSFSFKSDIELQAMPILKNCSVDQNSAKTISLDNLDRESKAYKVFNNALNNWWHIHFRHYKSQNGKYNLYFAEHQGIKEYDSDRSFYILVMNNELDVLHFSIHDYNYFRVESCIVANDGVAYVSTSNPTSVGMFSNKLKSERFLWIADHGKTERIEVNHSSKLIQSSLLVNEFENEVKLVYILANEFKFNQKMSGIEINSVNNRRELSFLSEIDASNLTVDDNEDFKRCDFKYFRPHSMKRTSNGSYYLVIEQYDIENLYSTPLSSSATPMLIGTVKFHNDIFILSLDNSFNFQKYNYLDKSDDKAFLSTRSTNYTAPVTFLNGDKLAILYNRFNARKTKGIIGVFDLTSLSMFLSVTNGDKLETFNIYDATNKNCIFKIPSVSFLDDKKLLIYGNSIVANGDETKNARYLLMNLK